MKQEHFDKIQTQFALNDVQMRILKRYLEAAFDEAADPVRWFQECDEIKDYPGMEETLEKAKEAMFNAIIDDQASEPIADVNEGKYILSQSTEEARCVDCGSEVLMGVCTVCGEY